MVPKINKSHAHGIFKGYVKDNVYAATVLKTQGEFKARITCWPVQKTDSIFQKVWQESEYHGTARPT
jgi:hypothetical protein